MKEHQFVVQSQFQGRLDGSGKLMAQGFEAPFSAPKELGGAGAGTHPEELLASAANTCFLITLGAILGFQKILVKNFTNHTEIGTTGEGPNLRINSIHHRLHMQIPREAGEEIKQRIEAAVRRAENSCLISQALKGNVLLSVTHAIEELQ